MGASSIRVVELLSRQPLSRDMTLLTFSARGKYLPTQFVMLDASPVRFLLRPFAVAAHDPRAHRVSVMVKAVGEASMFLAALPHGARVRMAGPFGNTEPLRSLERAARRGRVVLAAGGSGVAGIPFLYRHLRARNHAVTVVYGECSAHALVDLRRLGVRAPRYATDDGSCGAKGFVTDGVAHELRRGGVAAVFACGPQPMLQALASLMDAPGNRGIPCWVSLEEFMCCGRGMCRSCVVPLREASGTTTLATVCSDGPVFRLADLRIMPSLRHHIREEVA